MCGGGEGWGMSALALFGPVRPRPGVFTSESAKRAVRARSRGHCERCDQQASEFHHITYDHHGRERPDELEHLCAACHHAVHFDLAGDFWLNEDEKLSHWDAYHNAMERG